MTQLKSQYDEVRTPLAKMTFSPDVPSTALGPNEYNIGQNVETDVRGVRSVAGEVNLSSVPNFGTGNTGELLFVTSGFRGNGTYVFICAYLITTSSSTQYTNWYSTNDTQTWSLLLSLTTPYALNTNITCVWNGTVPIFNDTLNPPFFWLDGNVNMTLYSDTPPNTIASISGQTSTTTLIYFTTYYSSLYGNPFNAGDYVIITGTTSFDGTYQVVSSNTNSCTITTPNFLGITNYTGTISPQYLWNYYPDTLHGYLNVTANFLRMYSTPNVGSILVAGGLTYQKITGISTTTTEVFPVTVQWSQAFGLNSVPLTWQPTITDVANQLEVPLRGPCQDGFPSNGQFFICSYWDTVVFSPLNYTTTSAPILGVRLYNQGRGLLTSNCWANADDKVYGIDSRDVWVFDGQSFTGIGNQRVKNWLFDQIDPTYYNMIFMENNTEKSQIEIYYPNRSATNGIPNQMISYRYDLDCWNPPRTVSNAIAACESPIYEQGFTITPQYSSRCITFADATTNILIQKDIGASYANNSPIASYFERSNLKLLPNYSGKLMIHRVLPEAVNLGNVPFLSTYYNIQLPNSTGNLSVQIQGQDSVGMLPVSKNTQTIQLNTSEPWMQIDQNSFRVNNIIISNDGTDYQTWMTSAVTFQYTQVEDDR